MKKSILSEIVSEVRIVFKENLSLYAGFTVFIICISIARMLLFAAERSGTCGSFGLLVCGIFSGTGVYKPSSQGMLPLPAGWVAMLMFFPGMFSDTGVKDLNGYGLQKLIRQGRVRWWTVKIAALFVNCLFVMTVILGVSLLIPVLMNGKFIPAERDLYLYSRGYADLIADKNAFYISTLLVPCMAVFNISLISMLIGMVATPVISFACVSLYIMCGVFFLSPYFIVNQLMFLRGSYVLADGIVYGTSIVMDIILSGVCFVSGIWYMDRHSLV